MNNVEKLLFKAINETAIDTNSTIEIDVPGSTGACVNASDLEILKTFTNQALPKKPLKPNVTLIEAGGEKQYGYAYGYRILSSTEHIIQVQLLDDNCTYLPAIMTLHFNPTTSGSSGYELVTAHLYRSGFVNMAISDDDLKVVDGFAIYHEEGE